MFDHSIASVTIDPAGWGPAWTSWVTEATTKVRAGERAGWREVHRALVSIAKRRSALDAEEARWLREAEHLELWRELGMVSALDYMERVMGYGPHAAQERLRVARMLGQLPAMAEALASGAQSFSAVRELTRVAIPSTEREWLDVAASKNLRQIEQLVKDRKSGDRPGDLPHPELELQRVVMFLTPAAMAMWEQDRHDVDSEYGTRMSDSEFVEAIHGRNRVPANDDENDDGSGRAKYQVLIVRCDTCKVGWQEGGGTRMPLDAATLARVECDSQVIDSTSDHPTHATQVIPPAMVRFIHRRDGNRCQTPGCRSARALEIHHIVHREHGGDHSPENLTLRCFACHAAHHAGKLTIGGRAPDQLTFVRANDAASVGSADSTHSSHVGVTPSADLGQRRNIYMGASRSAGSADEPVATPAATAAASSGSHVGARHLDAVSTSARAPLGATARSHVGALDTAMVAEARSALRTAGWPAGVSSAAVEAATVKVGTADLATLIREALRCCPRRATY